MTNNITQSFFLYIYSYVMCAYMLYRAHVSWLQPFPISLIAGIIGLLSLLVISARLHYITTGKTFIIISLFIYTIFNVTVWRIGSVPAALFNNTCYFLSMTSILLLSLKGKVFLYHALSNCFMIMLLISLFGWFLFLVGVPLPHSGIIYDSNGFHVYYDYYFFRLLAGDYGILPRFSSLFLEPGQLATPCAFLYFINGASLSRRNVVLLIAILLSFSLISYGLVMMSFVANRFFSSEKRRVFRTMLAMFFIAGISLYFSKNENTDNPVSALIVSRLQYDEDKTISGNNRTTKFFDSMYEVFKDSPDKYWGIHKQLIGPSDWTYNCSGYKKVIVHFGFIGISLVLLIVFLLYLDNKSLATFTFFVIIMLAYFVRSLILTPLWFGIAILGFYMLKNQEQLKVEKISY